MMMLSSFRFTNVLGAPKPWLPAPLCRQCIRSFALPAGLREVHRDKVAFDRLTVAAVYFEPANDFALLDPPQRHPHRLAEAAMLVELNRPHIVGEDAEEDVLHLEVG